MAFFYFLVELWRTKLEVVKARRTAGTRKSGKKSQISLMSCAGVI
jgi:hypothetical protein